MKSLYFYLTLLAIKIKGIKSDFSRDPIDYKKLRKEDIHSPKIRETKQFLIRDTLITELGNSASGKKLLIYIHGGAFVYGPAKHHWEIVRKLSRDTDFTLWMVDYPKAPEHKIDVISQNIDQVYETAIENFGKDKIILAGDSVGGTLATALTQRLIKKKAPLPTYLILISPVMDCSFKNKKIAGLDKADPMLSRSGALSAKKMCSHNGDLEDPSISPINGNFKSFPPSLLFIAENDITSPDQEKLVTKLEEANVTHKIIKGKGMPHIWPLLPVIKEGKIAFMEMVKEINRIFP